jgi:hypothetical protein
MAENKEYKNTTGTDLKVLQNLEKSYFESQGPKSRRNIKKSMDWFRKRVTKNFSSVRTARMFRDQELFSDGLTLGKMHFFIYDPLHKDKLELWDTAPLVIPFSVYRTKDGSENVKALNFHYLSPVLRMAAFRALLRFKSRDRFVKSTKLDFSWKVIMALSQHKYFAHAVHEYRMDRVRSKFVEIPSQSWEMALFLPTQRFVKGTKAQAWKIQQ